MIRNGLLAAGNWIVDVTKVIDAYPQLEMLAHILSEESSNGGGPFNVLKDLAKMGAPFPLQGLGLIGSDSRGDWILDECARHGIDTTLFHRHAQLPTSFTDVFSVQETGRRSFFYMPGASGALSLEHFALEKSQAKILHLGYLMLLDEMDRVQANGESRAAALLRQAQELGFLTSVDTVTVEGGPYREVVLPALKYTDYCFVNELELGFLSGCESRSNSGIDIGAVRAGLGFMLHAGVRRTAFVHYPEGAAAMLPSGEFIRVASLSLPEGFIKGTSGAGDAFAAGVLWGLHEELPIGECLKQGVCAAAACISHPTTSEGLRPMAECLALLNA